MIDSHAHLSCATIREEVELLIARAQEAGLSHIVNICTDPEELEHGLGLTQKYPWIRLAGATTPHDVEKEGESAFPYFAKAAREGKLIAIGETGLDYFYQHSPREKQQEFFDRYIDLAKETHLPLIIHCREAFQDFFKMIDKKKYHRGLLHCFTGGVEEAQELVKRGWMISFSGMVTFKKSEGLREAVKALPLESILIETDTPYLAPQSKRGKQNEPAFILETARCIAALKGIEEQEFAALVTENFCRFFTFV